MPFIVDLQVFQQACGVPVLVMYASQVFRVHRASATLLLVTVKTVAIVVPRFLADRLGQRPMLLASAGGMAALLLVLGLSMSAAVAGAASWWAAVTCAEAVAAFRFSGRGLAGTCPARGSAPVEARGAVGEVCILEG
jgi:hypothetical protein